MSTAPYTPPPGGSQHAYRTQARALALQALCCFEAVGDAFQTQLDAFLTDEENLAELDIPAPPPPELLAFARSLADGAWAARPGYDARIEKVAARWSLQRMTPVDRNLLRMGLHEMTTCPQTPPPVVISECVALARRFGDTDSPAFVNGVLDALRKAGPA